MRTALFFFVFGLLATGLIGCGGSGGTEALVVGVRNGLSVYMEPTPPVRVFPPWSETETSIRINEIIPFGARIHPQSSGIYETTTQVAYGQVAGPMDGKKVVVYSRTNNYYIQPLDRTSIVVRRDGSWIAPVHSGDVYALVVSASYQQPSTVTILPAVDGVTVFAIAEEP